MLTEKHFWQRVRQLQKIQLMRKTRVRGRKIPKCLYHWSPRSRRASILKHGLQINRRSLDGQWKPHYICFSDNPARALQLCPHIPKNTVLDLYVVWPDSDYHVTRQSPGRGFCPEWRIYHDIPKKRLSYIASRKA